MAGHKMIIGSILFLTNKQRWTKWSTAVFQQKTWTNREENSETGFTDTLHPVGRGNIWTLKRKPKERQSIMRGRERERERERERKHVCQADCKTNPRQGDFDCHCVISAREKERIGQGPQKRKKTGQFIAYKEWHIWCHFDHGHKEGWFNARQGSPEREGEGERETHIEQWCERHTLAHFDTLACSLFL